MVWYDTCTAPVFVIQRPNVVNHYVLFWNFHVHFVGFGVGKNLSLQKKKVLFCTGFWSTYIMVRSLDDVKFLRNRQFLDTKNIKINIKTFWNVNLVFNRYVIITETIFISHPFSAFLVLLQTKQKVESFLQISFNPMDSVDFSINTKI